jgi:SNF2 family DNA or RNA helicase
MPPSGSPATSLDNLPASHRVTWDKNLHWRTSAGCSKRGRILSRGTLVICNVSLVGQWVEEAKSKLNDPGIIYCYYGANRKRDPVLLAKNAIVVTTYETLASVSLVGYRKDYLRNSYLQSIILTWFLLSFFQDFSHHAKKAEKEGQSGNYCAPLEQVRWWRIICDESQNLKDGNTQKSRAVNQIVADHKWLVSGMFILAVLVFARVSYML